MQWQIQFIVNETYKLAAGSLQIVDNISYVMIIV